MAGVLSPRVPSLGEPFDYPLHPHNFGEKAAAGFVDRASARESGLQGAGRLSWCRSPAAAWQLSFGTPQRTMSAGLLATGDRLGTFAGVADYLGRQLSTSAKGCIIFRKDPFSPSSL